MAILNFVASNYVLFGDPDYDDLNNGGLVVAMIWTGAKFYVFDRNAYFVAMSETGQSLDWDVRSWEESTPVGEVEVYAAAGDGAVAIGVGATYGGGGTNYCLRTTDGGATWVKTAMPSRLTWTGVCRTGSGRYVAVSSTGGSNAAATSDNNGATWTARNLSGSHFWDAVGAKGTILVAASSYNGKFSRSTDNGVTWSAAADLPLGGNYSGEAYAVSVFNGDFYILYGYDVLKSTDDGVTWTIVLTHIGPPEMRDMAVTADGILISCQYGNHYFSTDGSIFSYGTTLGSNDSFACAGGVIGGISYFIAHENFNANYGLGVIASDEMTPFFIFTF